MSVLVYEKDILTQRPCTYFYKSGELIVFKIIVDPGKAFKPFSEGWSKMSTLLSS